MAAGNSFWSRDFPQLPHAPGPSAAKWIVTQRCLASWSATVGAGIPQTSTELSCCEFPKYALPLDFSLTFSPSLWLAVIARPAVYSFPTWNHPAVHNILETSGHPPACYRGSFSSAFTRAYSQTIRRKSEQRNAARGWGQSLFLCRPPSISPRSPGTVDLHRSKPLRDCAIIIWRGGGGGGL